MKPNSQCSFLKPLVLLACSAWLLLQQGCTLPLLLAGGAAGVGYYIGAERRDADTITQDEKAEQYMLDLIQDAGIDTQQIIVRTFNHKMLLLGRVPDAETIRRLTQLAQKLPYVHTVYNRVHIGTPLNDKQKTEDALLATKIKTALIAEKGLNSATIKYEVFDGSVYLMGLVSEQEAQKAIAAVRKVKGVKKVIDAMDRL